MSFAIRLGRTLVLAALLILPPLVLAAQEPSAAAPLSLIPWPAQLTRAEGAFAIDARTVLVAGDGDTRATATWLAGQIKRRHGLDLRIVDKAGDGPAIVLRRDAKAALPSEGYLLDIDANGARIVARDGDGLFHGAVTLWQLLTQDDAKAGVPFVHIEDAPRFRWRGLMLDSARHFQSVEEIRVLIDQMALHKLNVLHWHLTDDQGWRIEIKRYPELTRIGAWRTPPGAGKDGEPARYGGFYTQEEIRAMVAYAAARHITIVPELDMPGHAQAAVASYPELGVTGKRPPVSVDWGVHTYLYNVDDATFVFMQHVLDEVMALFPSRYIHVGGDEAVKDQWQASPTVQAKIRALGLKDENALQGWFIARIGTYLKAHGRRLIGWDEILEGGVPADATVMSWRGIKGAVEAAQKGHDVVSSPAPDLYFDQLQSDRADETTGRIPVRDLASIYAFEPVPKELNIAQAKHVLGAQANVWTEHMPSIAHVQHAVFPRLDALSEVLWSPAAARDWKGFLARMPAQLARYRADGIAYADGAFAPSIDVDRNAALVSGKATVMLANQAGFGQLHYTLDGSTPTASSPLYAAPFETKLPTTVRAIAVDARGEPLAAPRERVLDVPGLLTRASAELPNCPGSDFRLRVQPTPDATSLAPAYNINIFDTCQRWPEARLDGIAAIHVEAARLERNYQLAHDAKLVVSRPASTAHGELVAHLDSCDGKVLASMPLPDPSGPRRFALNAQLPLQKGTHELCLIFTAPITGPLYGIERASLTPAKP
ncbi:family 20 glycosylhydrolase [Dyella sp. BiH032]|uniref:family 20 glycosylhydrolase n=1 Tax=Dyella sp. BiH032 TaxID=3075430 RepID=UPI0028929C8C|nr:family 20 glycosylhydrolase [Dyella sp. BiH032]WNL46079.1 family 20 glycosylhydrolase [Dyella sp. BiH032]